MRRSIDDYPYDPADGVDGDDELARISWAVAIADDYDDGQPRVVLTVEEVGRPGQGLVTHLSPRSRVDCGGRSGMRWSRWVRKPGRDLLVVRGVANPDKVGHNCRVTDTLPARTGLGPGGLRTRPIDAEQLADIEKFEQMLVRYLAGDLTEDVFRVFRLGNGIYGQRQGGQSQMVRVKVPYGSIEPEQLEMVGWLVDNYSRGWGHITTRQNIQFHFVALTKIPEVMRHLASVGLTTREACGDTVRNIQGCHLAGACPHEVLDISPWAEAAFRHFVRNPLGQRLPRKFKINFSGCQTDCGQAMFNDVGIIATKRTNDGVRSNPASGCTSPEGWARTRTPRSPSRTSRPARSCCRRSKRCCGCSTRRATATTSCERG